MDAIAFRRRLLRWYDRSRRPLPWREKEIPGGEYPWRVLVSELMLQQTRVGAVIPFYHRFLRRFPNPRSLAEASEMEVLAAWSGLGYYSRARNLQRAARVISDRYPATYQDIRKLPGVGPYTAAAVASIAFGLPHAAVDGNVLRVISRISNDAGDIGSAVTRGRFAQAAQTLLDPRRPGDFNQAMMELGATVCLPRSPLCLTCPVERNCAARQLGRQDELPVKASKATASVAEIEIVAARLGDSILLRQRSAEERRMPRFWELPARQSLPEGIGFERVASFRHTIVNTRYIVALLTATVEQVPSAMHWFPLDELDRIPLTTISRKAMALLANIGTAPRTPFQTQEH